MSRSDRHWRLMALIWTEPAMVHSFINLKKQVNEKKCVGNNQALVGITVSIGVVLQPCFAFPVLEFDRAVPQISTISIYFYSKYINRFQQTTTEVVAR